jgi:hypothetical protein
MHADVNELQPDLGLVLPAPFTLIQILAFVSQQEKLARKRKGDMHHHFRPAFGAINDPTGNDGVAGGWHDETGSDIDLFSRAGSFDVPFYHFRQSSAGSHAFEREYPSCVNRSSICVVSNAAAHPSRFPGGPSGRQRRAAPSFRASAFLTYPARPAHSLHARSWRCRP